MLRHLWIRIAAITVVVCWGVFAHADQVVLKNGDTITGKIAKMEKGKIQLTTSYMGSVQIEWSDVAKVKATEPLHVAFLHQDLEVSSLETKGEVTTIHTLDDRSLALPRGMIEAVRSQKEEEAAYLQEVHQRPPELWLATINAGLSAARGNSTTTTMNAGATAARVTEKNRLTLSFASLFSVAGTSGATQTTANSIRSSARYEINAGERMYTFTFANFDSDRVQELDLRSVLGGGLGYRAVQNKKLNLNLYTGASYDHEVFQTAPTAQTAEGLFGQDMMIHFSPRNSLEQRLAIYPNITNSGDYRASLDVNSTTMLNRWLGWQFTLSDVYVSAPPLGAKSNDMIMSTGLRVVWGKQRAFQPKLTPMQFPDQ